MVENTDKEEERELEKCIEMLYDCRRNLGKLDNALIILSDAVGGDNTDWEYLLNKITEWDLDILTVLEFADKHKTIDSLTKSAYNLRKQDLKEEISNYLVNLVDENENTTFNIRKFDNFDFDMFTENPYGFWFAKNVNDIIQNYKNSFIDFLINEKIFEIKDKNENETREILKSLIK
jgi:hypothetical protein